MRPAQASFRVFKKERRPVHVAETGAGARDSEVLQRLQRASQAFHVLVTIVACGLFQFLEGGDTEVLGKPEDLVRPQAGTASISRTPSGISLRIASRAGCVPCLCSFVTISAIASPIPGISVRRSSAMIGPAAPRGRRGSRQRGHRPWPDTGCPRAEMCARQIPGAGRLRLGHPWSYWPNA
jgi:hypothetical protein